MNRFADQVRTSMKPLMMVLALAPVVIHTGTSAAAQSRGAAPQAPVAANPPASASTNTASVAPPPDYVIGPDDVLSVVFWREKDLTTDVVVRPDGRISIPLLNDITVTGLTPEQVREKLTVEAARFVQDPNVTIIVKQINSRHVFITGEVAKPGPYPLNGPTTVLQLISIAGGFLEYADSKNVLIMRNEGGRPTSHRFNYKEVIERRNLTQNIELKPGDTVIVP
jgi:polysaccharide export outer membrane protein